MWQTSSVDDPVEEFWKELVERRLGDDFQLGLAAKELVEEAAEPEYGQEHHRRVLGCGGQEFREVVSDVLLKTLLLQNCPYHVIFFATLTMSNMCHGVNKTFFLIVIS